jgi:hypothetical protein
VIKIDKKGPSLRSHKTEYGKRLLFQYEYEVNYRRISWSLSLHERRVFIQEDFRVGIDGDKSVE